MIGIGKFTAIPAFIHSTLLKTATLTGLINSSPAAFMASDWRNLNSLELNGKILSFTE